MLSIDSPSSSKTARKPPMKQLTDSAFVKPEALRRVARRLLVRWARSPQTLRAATALDSVRAGDWAQTRHMFQGAFASIDGTPMDGVPRLEAQLRRMVRKARARVGAAALHLETGIRVSLNGTDRFPMAS